MHISHWLYPVHVLGPGSRLVLWTQGCSRHCKGCVSPEFRPSGGTDYPVEELSKELNTILRRDALQGVTISGGEPFEQAEDLFALCHSLACDDILVYSGWTYTEICRQFSMELPHSGIGVLITGPYVEELNDNLPLRGSSNQEIVFLRPDLRAAYDQYLQTGSREQELFVSTDHVYLAGIPEKGTAEAIQQEIEKILQEE